jgi:cation transport regulator ChaC
VSAPLWIFGYGSLIWRPAFAHAERRTGYLEGWARRFWQGSPDHRGVPEAPGRVATLVRETGAVCWGVAYRVEEAAREAVLRTLDHRESGGFERHRLTVHSRDAAQPELQALVYVAGPANPNFLGPSPLPAMAEQVRNARGRSGPDPAAHPDGVIQGSRERDFHRIGMAVPIRL